MSLNQRHLLVTGDLPFTNGMESDFPGTVTILRDPADQTAVKNALALATDYILGGPEYLGAELLSAAENLRRVVVMGTGTPSFVDQKIAEERGVRVYNTPGHNAEAVAEFALGVLLTMSANFSHSRDQMLAGSWYQTPYKQLRQQTIGIVGLGAIGGHVAKLLGAFKPREIIYFSPNRKHELEDALNISYVDFDSLVERSDSIMLHCGYNDATHGLFAAEQFQQMKANAKLFCFANPWIINPNDLLAALDQNQINFAYMDGFFDEWVACGGRDDERGILQLPASKFVATSHIAAQTESVLESMLAEAFAVLLREGDECEND